MSDATAASNFGAAPDAMISTLSKPAYPQAGFR
jgi:hypothetical protein